MRAGLRKVSQRVAGLLLVVLLAVLGLGATALPAQAAAGTLVASEPDTNTQLDDAPGWVTLAFDSKINKKMAKIIVTDASGDNVTDGPLIVENTNVTTQLSDDLKKGTYTVHYRVNGSGDEPRGGAFQFSYGQGSFSDQPDKSWSGTAQEPEILRGDQPNGPEVSAPPATETPGVEVTSSETSDADPTTSPPKTQTTKDPDDPDQTGTDDPTDTQDPSDSATDPSAASTATAVQSGPNKAFLIGGIVLLLGAGGAGYGLYRSSRRGDHS